MVNCMVTAIIQARVGSTRFPNKVFAELAGKPLIFHVVNRLKHSQKINKILLATTENLLDDALESWAKLNRVEVFRGSEENVLDRYYKAAESAKTDIVVRVTADDPFKDPVIMDKVIDLLQVNNLDFAYNNKPSSFPEGLDTEVFTFKALRQAHKNAKDAFEREHVTQYFYRNSSAFKQRNFLNYTDLSYLRWTIDTELDLSMVKEVYNALYKDSSIFLTEDILALLRQRPEIARMNADVPRSAMYSKKI